MNRPHCNHSETRVTETRSTDSYDLRVRLCLGCSQTFQTIERVTVLTAAQHQEVANG